MVNDLSRVKSSTPEPNDKLHDSDRHEEKVITWTRDGQFREVHKNEAPGYQVWQRKLMLYLYGELIIGMKLRIQGTANSPTREWVTMSDILIYWAHICQHVIHAPNGMRMEFPQARMADLQYRQRLQDSIRSGRTLGEAIKDNMNTLMVLIHYNIPTQSHDRPQQRQQNTRPNQNTPNRPKGGGRQPNRDTSQKKHGHKGGAGRSRTRSPPKKGPDTPRFCHEFNKTGKCSRGNSCKFLHKCSKCKKPNCKGAFQCKN